MRFLPHDHSQKGSPRILITSKNRAEEKISIELLDLSEELSASYSLTLIGVGGDIELSPPKSGIITSPLRKSPFFQIEGNMEELNHFLRKTSFSPRGDQKGKSWITIHIEKVGAQEPILDRAWREVRHIPAQAPPLEESISRHSEKASVNLPLQPTREEIKERR